MTADEISVTFKVSSGQKFELRLCPSLTVLQTKEKTEEKCDIPVSQQRLIYRGRILKDPDTLTSYGVASGHTIHLVRISGGQGSGGTSTGTASTTSTAPPAPATTPSAQPQPTGTIPPATTGGGLGAPPMTGVPPNLENVLGAFGASGLDTGGAAGGLGGLLGGGLPGGMNPQMFQALMSNPAVTSMMQEVMRNPDLLRTMLQANPLLSSTAQGNPMLQSLLNNPDFLQAAMSPEMMQSVMGLQQAFHQQGGLAGVPPAGGSGVPMGGTPGVTAPSQANGAGNVDWQAMMSRMLSDPQLQQHLRQSMAHLGTGNIPAGGFGDGSATTVEDVLSRIMGGAAGGGLGGATSMAAPTAATPEALAARYQRQLEVLEDMGFIDREANIDALHRANGDVNAAISWLLETGRGN